MAEPFTIYKLIVLYMAQHSKEALTNSQISEFVLDREYTDYFQLQKVLSELTETGLLNKRTISNSSYYELTKEGSSTLSYFEKNLSKERCCSVGKSEIYRRMSGECWRSFFQKERIPP